MRHCSHCGCGLDYGQSQCGLCQRITTWSNDDLQPGDVPTSNQWSDIQQLALSFSGRDYWGEEYESRGHAAQVRWSTDEMLPDSLSDLRACLYFEQRRWREYGEDPDDAAMHYIVALIEAIRQKASSDPAIS